MTFVILRALQQKRDKRKGSNEEARSVDRGSVRLVDVAVITASRRIVVEVIAAIVVVWAAAHKASWQAIAAECLG